MTKLLSSVNDIKFATWTNSNEQFGKYASKLGLLIKKNEFKNAKKLIEMKSTQIQTFISESEHQIENVLGKEILVEINSYK